MYNTATTIRSGAKTDTDAKGSNSHSTGRAPATSSQLAPAPPRTPRTELLSGLILRIWTCLPICQAPKLAGACRYYGASPVSTPTTVATRQVFASGADAIHAQRLLEVPPVPRHPRRHFGSSLTTQSGEDYRTPIGSRSRWRHRGDDETHWTGFSRQALGTGNRHSAFSPRKFALLGRSPEPAPPNQPPVSPDTKWRGTTGAFSA